MWSLIWAFNVGLYGLDVIERAIRRHRPQSWLTLKDILKCIHY